MSQPYLRTEQFPTGIQQAAYIWAMLIVLALVIFGFTMVIGGAKYGVIAMGALAMPYLFWRPQAAIWYAPVFMMLAFAIFPQEFRSAGEDTHPALYVWAVGLFLITLPLAWRLPWTQLLTKVRQHNLPRAFAVFMLVVGAASLQGLRSGATLSYVLRQAYGVLLLCVYFWATVHFTTRLDEIQRNMRLITLVGAGVCLFTLIYWIGVQQRWDAFKWDLCTYAAMLAAYCAGEFLCAKGLFARLIWAVQCIIFLVHALVFHSRGPLGFCVIVMMLGVGLLLPSKKVKLLALTGVLAFLVLAIETNIFAPLRHVLPDIGGAADIVPEDIISDPSFYSRIDQWLTAIQVTKTHPFLGTGLGSELEYFDPSTGTWGYRAIVDPGYPYLFSKLGLVGLASLSWLLVSVARSSGWPRRHGLHLGLFLIFFYCVLHMFNGPIMLHFITAAWAGICFGFLYQLRRLPPQTPSRSTIHQF
jgi:hypothetical protein